MEPIQPNQPTEVEILDTVIGGITIRDMTGLTFLQWLSKKVNGLSYNDSRVVELTARLSSPVLGKMPEEDKINIVRKLISLNIEIK